MHNVKPKLTQKRNLNQRVTFKNCSQNLPIVVSLLPLGLSCADYCPDRFFLATPFLFAFFSYFSFLCRALD